MSFVEGSMSLDLAIAPGALERLQKQLTNLEKGIRVPVAADTKGLGSGARGLDGLNASAKRTADTVNNKLGGAAKATAATFGVLAAAGGAGLATIVTKAIMAGKEFNVLQQQVRASLTAILGTSQAAEGLLVKVNKLNDTSPFPRSAFLSATQQLVGFGVSAEKVTPILDSVQEAVAGIGGNANDIQMFTRAFAQIQSQGRLTGDVLFSLGAKGVDAAAIIGKQMGKTGTEIKDQVSKGAIGADQAIDLLTTGLKAKFNGAVANVAKSYIGAADRVTARLRDIGADITKAFINPLGGGAAVDGLNNIAVGLSNIRKNVISQLLPGVQSLADLFVKATEAFKNFTANIKMDQVQKFLDIFKMLSPLVALVGTSLVKTLGGQIPILRTFTGALNGPVIALLLFAATVPAVREAVMKMAEALRPVVETLLLALTDTLTTAADAITTMGPLVTGLATAFVTLVSAATPLLKLLEFGPVQAVLTMLIGRFLLMKLAGMTAFSGIAGSAAVATMSIRTHVAALALSVKMMGTLGAAGAAGMTAVRGIGTALAGLVSPANAAVAAIVVITTMLSDAKGKADELAASITKGLDVDVPEELEAGLARVNNLLREQAALNASQSNSEKFWQFLPWVANEGFESAEALKALREERDLLLGKKAIKNNIISDVMAISKVSIEEVIAKAKELNIVLSTVGGDRVGATVKQISDAISAGPTKAESGWDKLKTALSLAADSLDKIRGAQDKLTASQRGVRDAMKGVENAERTLADLRRVTAQELADRVTKAELNLADARRGVAVAADRLVSSELALTQAKRAVGQADERLAELTKERTALLADTTRATRELASAEADALRIKQEILDQGQQEEALLRNQADLAEEGPDKLAAADRAILRAKIALNSATREEKELLESLNKTQTAGLDLSGLSLDQIKTKLAGARAELAIQRSTTKNKKTQEQLDDEKLSAGLNVLDAEQAHKDAIEARGDLEIDLGIQKRENEEALATLLLDQQATLRRQYEQQVTLSALRAGDTETARTLKRLNEEIIVATDGITAAALTLKAAEREVFDAIDDQKSAAIGVRDAQRETETAARGTKDHADAIKTATEGIQRAQEAVRDAQKIVKADAAILKGLVADQLGDQQAINGVLVARLGVNASLLAQNPGMVDKLVDSILGPALMGPHVPGSKEDTAALLRSQRVGPLADILMNHPDKLVEFLRSIGMPLAQGGIITQHTFAQLGEGGKAEVVLPLTKPGRAMTLLAQSIPKMHTALQAKLAPALKAPVLAHPSLAQPPIASALQAAAGASRRGTSSKATQFVGRNDGPVTYGQLEELIALIRENKGEFHFEAPITVVSSGDDVALARKISKKVERQVNDILSRR